MIISSLGMFCVGFISRPLGGIIFGHIGDKIGRKNALSGSMLFMGIITVLIGFIGCYDDIGILSPIIMLSLRFAQGLCLSGEYNGSAIFFIEHYDGKYVGFFSSLISAFAIIGFFAASATILFCSKIFDENLAWRVPFFVGGTVAIIAYIIRKTISETPIFLENQRKQNVAKIPILEVLKSHYVAVIITILVGWNMSSISLTIFGYLTTHLNKFLNINFDQATIINQIAMIFYFIATPISGLLADRFSPEKVMIIAVSTILTLSALAYYLISLKFMIAGSIMLAVMAGFFLGPSNLFIYNLFPGRLRYSGICFSFSMGVAVLGGIAPMISGLLVMSTNNLVAPSLYLMISALFGLIGLIIYKNNNRLISALPNHCSITN